MKLTRQQVINELREEIRVFRRSYRETDGVIRNREALRVIAALTEAIRIVKAYKP